MRSSVLWTSSLLRQMYIIERILVNPDSCIFQYDEIKSVF